MLRKVFCLMLACGTFLCRGQQVRPANSEKIYHEIGRLRHLVNVLYMAAHPDDENTRFLAWMANEKNIRTGYLSLTRGDGGQNILGSEQGEALGLIRTHELIEARKLDGAEQYFTRAIDFGFSKSFQETFLHWNRDSLVKDAVWVIRNFRPDVIICRFPPNTQAGHGQHAVSAIVAADAFKASGDASRYPEFAGQVAVWQPKRILWNTYRFGDRNTTSEDQLKLKVGQYEADMGMGSGELAGMSRSIHKSQGAGTPSVPGVQTEYFKYVDGDTAHQSLFDGIDITWGRVGRREIGVALKALQEQFDFMHPDASLPALLAVRKQITTVKDDYWRTEKLKEIDQIILDCTGFMAELYAKQPQSVAAATLPFTLHLIARSELPVIVTGINWLGNDSTYQIKLSGDSLYTMDRTLTVPAETPITQPYWLANEHPDKDLFTIQDYPLTGLPETPNHLAITVNLKVGSLAEQVIVPLSYKKTDPVKGDVVEQLRIVPDAVVSFANALLVAGKDGTVHTDISIHANKALTGAELLLTGDMVDAAAIHLPSLRANEDTTISVNIPKGKFNFNAKDEGVLKAGISVNGMMLNRSIHLIQYNHLPTLQYFTPATAKVIRNNWKCAVKHIGYIDGAGDHVAEVLRSTGLDVTILKESDIKNPARLQQFDAIVTGIRAVNVEKRMNIWMPYLLKYVEKGGTLVMQYNTLQDLSTTDLGPYPFTLSDKRVTEEDAAVSFNDPSARLLNVPNKIVAADFADWVQERGLYFAGKWDDHYKPVFSMNDKDEQPLSGSTLYAEYGKGKYIYTGLSFSRQLPAGNTGAIKLFMNMLSAGKHL